MKYIHLLDIELLWVILNLFGKKFDDVSVFWVGFDIWHQSESWKMLGYAYSFGQPHNSVIVVVVLSNYFFKHLHQYFRKLSYLEKRKNMMLNYHHQKGYSYLIISNIWSNKTFWGFSDFIISLNKYNLFRLNINQLLL